MPRNARHKALLADPDVQRWYDNHDSWKTADGRLRNLGLFCERTGVTPKALAGMEPKQYTDLLQDYLKTYPGYNADLAAAIYVALMRVGRQWSQADVGSVIFFVVVTKQKLVTRKRCDDEEDTYDDEESSHCEFH